MSSNSFDALLDFGESTPADNGTIQQNSSDAFDPFGPSPTIDVKGNSGGGDLLVDFGFGTQTSEDKDLSNSSGFNLNTSDNINPLYELSTSDISSSSSPSVKMSATEPSNPLYELSQEEEQPQKQNLSSGTNPLYDLMSSEDQNGHTTISSDDSGVTMATNGEDMLISVDTKMDSVNFEQTNGIHESVENGYVEEKEDVQEKEELLIIDNDQQEVSVEPQVADDSFTQEVTNDVAKEVTDEFTQEVTEEVIEEDNTPQEQEVVEEKEEVVLTESSPRNSASEDLVNMEFETQQNLIDTQEPEPAQQEPEIVPQEPEIETEQTFEQVEYTEQVTEQVDEPEPSPTEESLVETEQYQQEPEPQAEQNLVDVEQEVADEQEDVKGGKLVTTSTEQKTTVEDSGAGQVKRTTTTTTTYSSGQAVQENGLDDDEANRDPNVFRETREKEEVHFGEMSNVKSMFESGKCPSETTVVRKSVHEEMANVEAGEYENEPVKDPNVIRESDRNIGEELPEVGMAKSRLEKFKEIEATSHTPVTSKKRELTPPDRAGPMEYVSEPRHVVEKYESKIEGGVFENEPIHPEGVVRAGEVLEDVKPEQGSAKNLLAKFKQIEETTKHQPAPSPGKRELTPDRTGKVEYVSEPRAVLEKYEGKVEAGVFESQPQDTEVVKSGAVAEEVLPERGTALNLVSKFKQIEKESKSPPSPAGAGFKRELTPDKSGKVEYVSEPRGKVETYEGVSESGVFESHPKDQPEIVKSNEYTEEVLPEVGFARNVAAKFKELEKSGGSSPSSTPTRRKEFTPPREEEGKFVSGVLESTPQERPDIIKSSDVNVHVYEEELPERGMARNITERFRKIQSSPAESPARSKKEFTPPPQSQAGVFENTPAPSLVVETRTAESGILENQPSARPDIAREHSVEEQELPEQGFAKNMVSKWKQMESESGKQSPSPSGGKRKEFTPPRDEPRIKSPLSPKSPAGMNSSVHPNDLPGQYQEQVSPGVFENQPEFREDLARETDTDWAEGLPNKDTTRNLVDKFKHIQDDAKAKEETPKPVSRKDSTSDSSQIQSPAPTPKKPKSPFVAVQLEKCAACGKTVYAMEKVEMNNQSYHKACFKCSHCKSRLTAKTFSVNQGVIYCTNHFKQLFARKGNYDEGFGRQQYKVKWQEQQQKSLENGDGPAA